MLTTKLVRYLAPYLPAQALTLISIIGFGFERILLPRIQEVYSNASLDPQTLLPFIFTAIALYLTFVSIYHAVRASARLVWFGTKWSIVIIGLWFILGAVNDLGQNYRGVTPNSRYGSRSSSSWWPNSRRKNSQESVLEPIKLLLTQIIPSIPDPANLFESFFSPLQPTTSSNYQSKSSEDPSKPPSRASSSSQSKKTRKPLVKEDEDQEEGYLMTQKIWEFVVQNVREPVVAMVREAKLKNHQREQDSRTRNR